MVTGAPESTLNDGGRQATSPPSDIVSRSELNDILKANNAAIIAALQQQLSGTKQPAVPHEIDAVTTLPPPLLTSAIHHTKGQFPLQESIITKR